VPARPKPVRTSRPQRSAPRNAPRPRPKVERVEGIDMPKRTLQGVVVSDKQHKTLVVRVERRFTHPLFKKTVRHSKKYYAHDEKIKFTVGDIVGIEEHPPISKLKRWAVVRGEKRQTSP